MPRAVLPRRTESVAAAVEFVEGVVRGAGWPEGEVSRVALVTSEAAANAVEHGPGGAATFAVGCRLDGGAAVVTVTDGGPGPDAAALRTARLPESVYATGGRGLHIMRQLADAVGVEGGALRLHFRCRG